MTISGKSLLSPITLGSLIVDRPVFLAPMSGVTDLPFRELASDLGAPMVVTEMVASRELVQDRKDVARKATRPAASAFVIQLVGCETHWMAEGARIAEQRGADVIDINMGCPAREVTGKHSGSALMRDLDHAQSLIEAVVRAVEVPVTLKMRLGWDDATRNAPDLAVRAERAGVVMVTVHARTRNQFFKGTADWLAVQSVKSQVAIPVIVNGDITDPRSAAAALASSAADGIMIGRGAYGAPWQPGRLATALAGSPDPGPPSISQQSDIALRHYDAMLAHYGTALGVRNARKHIGWYLAVTGMSAELAAQWRRRLCQDDDPVSVRSGLRQAYGTLERHAA